jgi:hypothetical protein
MSDMRVEVAQFRGGRGCLLAARSLFVVSGFLLCATTSVAAGRDGFDGKLVNLRGDGRTEEGFIETGGQMSSRGADGTYLFAVHLGRDAQAYLVLLWKPAPGSPKDWTALTDEAVVETWLWTEPLVRRVLASPEQFNEQRDFLNVTAEQRRRVEGAFPLKGKVHVRRFLSNVDFQLDLDVATETKPPRSIKGTLYGGGSKPEGAAPPAEPVPKKAPAPPPGVALDEPLKAVRAYAEALRDGDEEKLRSLHHTAGKDSEEAVELFIRWVKSSVRLERAAAAKFGRAGADDVSGLMLLPPPGQRGRDMLENLDGGGIDAEVEVRGDRASVDIDPVGTIELRRVEGQWGSFIPAKEAGVGAGGYPMPDHAPLLKALTSAQDRVADDIAAGRIRTVKDAMAAAERAMGEYAKVLGVEADDEGDDEPE